MSATYFRTKQAAERNLDKAREEMAFSHHDVFVVEHGFHLAHGDEYYVIAMYRGQPTESRDNFCGFY